MEMMLELPCGVISAAILLEFDKGFLRIDEYPPDANQGFDIPSALISFPNHHTRLEFQEESSNSPLLSKLKEKSLVQSYTEVLLVPLTTPDFSMPYYVIWFTSLVFLFINDEDIGLDHEPTPIPMPIVQPGPMTRSKSKQLTKRINLAVQVFVASLSPKQLYHDIGSTKKRQEISEAIITTQNEDKEDIFTTDQEMESEEEEEEELEDSKESFYSKNQVQTTSYATEYQGELFNLNTIFAGDSSIQQH